MALYEYECPKCSNVFEVLTSKPTDKSEKCPECRTTAKRLISKNTFSLKEGGVGWAKESYSKK